MLLSHVKIHTHILLHCFHTKKKHHKKKKNADRKVFVGRGRKVLERVKRESKKRE